MEIFIGRKSPVLITRFAEWRVIGEVNKGFLGLFLARYYQLLTVRWTFWGWAGGGLGLRRLECWWWVGPKRGETVLLLSCIARCRGVYTSICSLLRLVLAHFPSIMAHIPHQGCGSWVGLKMAGCSGWDSCKFWAQFPIHNGHFTRAKFVTSHTKVWAHFPVYFIVHFPNQIGSLP